MTRTENGYAPQSGQFRRAMEAIPDLYAEQMPRWDMLEMDPLLDSSNMTVHEWNKIAQLVADHYDAYDGFVVLHGTDTMAYTASALSFMLEGLAKPVILTGSQIPMCEIRSDGRDNLITSLLIAGAGEVHEVCLYFGRKLLRGNRATKFSADGLIAFLSPNYPSLADAGITIRYNESALLPKPKGALKLQLLENIPIGVLKVFPGIQFSLFEQIMTERLRGIVIETFGAGNIPGDGGALLPIIEKAFHNGTVLTVCSQCPQGAVALGAYETSNALKRAGAVSGLDMTTEAAVAKLYYLFSCGYEKERVKPLMEQDGMTQLELVNLTQLKAPTISITLRNMEREGIVRREKNDVDRRETHVYITEKGREMHAKILEAFDRAEQLMLKDISEKEQATARKILAKMTENLRREVGGDIID